MRRKKESASELKLVHELAAIVLMGLGALMLLALISFEANDVPFFSVGNGGQVDNLIGPVGAWVAGGFVLFFGVAAYMIPLVMLLGGLLLIFAVRVNYLMKCLWFLLIIVTGAGLLQFLDVVVQPIEGMDWPGGFIGYVLHDKLLAQLIGEAGSVIVLLMAYASSLVLLFEIRPVELVRQGWNTAVTWYDEREKRRFEEADPLERLELEKRKLEKKQKKLQRRLDKESRKRESPEEETDEEIFSPKTVPREPEPSRRPPKVIDSMAVTENGTAEEIPVLEEARKGSELNEAGAEAMTDSAQNNQHPDSSADRLNPMKPLQKEVFPDYQLPPITELQPNDSSGGAGLDENGLMEEQQLLVDTLRQFGIEVEPGDITRGATITRYEVYPAPGVRVERIAKMNKDLARALRAESVNILAPIPGKDTVGIEIGNADKAMIVLRDLFETDSWKRSKAKLPIALGKDVYGKVLIADLAEMPHLLIGGSTGSGKSVCINSILMSFLYRFSPEDLRIIMVDPKVVELQVYNDLPHLVVPVVTEPKKVLMALRWVINEMELRYRHMAKCGVRNIAAYNAKREETRRSHQEQEAPESEDALPGLGPDPESQDSLPQKLPFIVVIIDELADLMATSAAEVELAIARLSAKARAAGIHLIIATQTPRAQVVTGVIKTNVPCRIAFKVPSALDSRVILDENGAENLLGKGDMLYLPPGSSKQLRAQGAFVSDNEVSAVVDFIKNQHGPAFEQEIHQKLVRSGQEVEEELSEADQEYVRKGLEVALQEKKLSTSLLQRRARIGYNTAARVVDFLEARRILGPQEGSKPRELLVSADDFDIDQFMEEL